MNVIGVCVMALCAINLWTFAAFGYDKRQSLRRGWRVPEANLLLWSALGGSLGALCGRQLFRHKTRKQPFVNHLFAIVLMQTVAIGALIGWRLSAP